MKNIDDVMVTMTNTEEKLTIRIQTPRLLIRSVRLEDIDAYCALFSSPEVMGSYATGKIKNREDTQKRLKVWVERQRDGNPYHGLAVFKKQGGDFLGHAVVGYSGEAGVAEFAGLGNACFWRKGYGSEAAYALIKHLVPLLSQGGYDLGSKPLTEVIATARIDNVGSQQILRKLGFHTNYAINRKFGAQRYIYRVDVDSLCKEHTSMRAPAARQNILRSILQWGHWGIRYVSRPLAAMLSSTLPIEKEVAHIAADALVLSAFASVVIPPMARALNDTRLTGTAGVTRLFSSPSAYVQ